jgi:type IV pilus assembly protein PilC
MKQYAYEAADSEGKRVQGALYAEDERLAVRQLQERGYFVTRVQPWGGSGERRPGVFENIFERVRTKDLAIMLREMASMLGAGMGIVAVFDVLGRNTMNRRLRQAIIDMSKGVQAGDRLSNQMARFPTLFDEVTLSVIRAAENTGRLDDMLRLLSEHLEYRYELEQTVRRESAYPKIVLGFIILVLLFLLLFPHAQEWGATIAVLVGVGICAAIVAGVFLWIGLWRALMSSSYVQSIWDSVKLAIPILGTQLRRLAMARFARTLATMYEAGVTIREGVAPAGRATGYRSLAEAIAGATIHIDRGGKLSDALAATYVVPETVLAMVRTGEESGQLGVTLNKVADYQEEEARTAIHQICVSILPVAIVFLAVIVLIILVRFYLGYYAGVMKAA